jgi:hypothetical protein
MKTRDAGRAARWGRTLKAGWTSVSAVGAAAARGFFLGWQGQLHGRRPLALFQLEQDLIGHPAGSTVSALTILRAGYRPPTIPCQQPGCRKPAAWVRYGASERLGELAAAAWCGACAWRRSGDALVRLGEALAD